jgi:hypothetical protein
MDGRSCLIYNRKVPDEIGFAFDNVHVFQPQGHFNSTHFVRTPKFQGRSLNFAYDSKRAPETFQFASSANYQDAVSTGKSGQTEQLIPE